MRRCKFHDSFARNATAPTGTERGRRWVRRSCCRVPPHTHTLHTHTLHTHTLATLAWNSRRGHLCCLGPQPWAKLLSCKGWEYLGGKISSPYWSGACRWCLKAAVPGTSRARVRCCRAHGDGPRSRLLYARYLNSNKRLRRLSPKKSPASTSPYYRVQLAFKRVVIPRISVLLQYHGPSCR